MTASMLRLRQFETDRGQKVKRLQHHGQGQRRSDPLEDRRISEVCVCVFCLLSCLKMKLFMHSLLHSGFSLQKKLNLLNLWSCLNHLDIQFCLLFFSDVPVILGDGASGVKC